MLTIWVCILETFQSAMDRLIISYIRAKKILLVFNLLDHGSVQSIILMPKSIKQRNWRNAQKTKILPLPTLDCLQQYICCCFCLKHRPWLLLVFSLCSRCYSSPSIQSFLLFTLLTLGADELKSEMIFFSVNFPPVPSENKNIFSLLQRYFLIITSR